MFINELEVGSKVALVCSEGHDKRTFYASIVEVSKDKNAILIEAITYNDKVVNFDVGQFVIEASLGKKAVIFKIDKIATVRQKGVVYHIIQSATNAEPVNRRDAVRVGIGAPCTLKYGPRRTLLNCYVKDLSHTGIGFTLKELVDINVGDEVSATFKYGDNRVIFKIYAKVVRINWDNTRGNLTVGAELKSLSHEVKELIMAIQRAEAQRLRG